MNRLKKQIYSYGVNSDKYKKLRDYSDSKNINRSKKETGIYGKGFYNSAARLYKAIMNKCKTE